MFKKQVDERILDTRRKVASQAFYFTLWGLMIILLYRQFYLKQEFADYDDIFVLWMIGAFYVTIRGTLSGINLFGERKVLMIVVPLVFATTNLGVSVYRGTIGSVWEGFIVYLTSLAGAFAMYYLLLLLYRRWEKKNLD